MARSIFKEQRLKFLIDKGKMCHKSFFCRPNKITSPVFIFSGKDEMQISLFLLK